MPTALITGASSGLGVDFSHHFAQGGHDVVLLARSKDKLESLAAELQEKYSIKAHVLVKDLSVKADLDSIFPELKAQGVEIEFLVNHAGFGHHAPFAELPWKDHQDLMRVNMEALSKELEGTGVTILCPGPTQTAFFDKAGMNTLRLLKSGQMQSSKEVAAFGYRKMMQGKRTVISGTMNKIGAFVSQLAPKSLVLSAIQALHKST